MVGNIPPRPRISHRSPCQDRNRTERPVANAGRRDPFPVGSCQESDRPIPVQVAVPETGRHRPPGGNDSPHQAVASEKNATTPNAIP
jgi:hypothetical protein